METGPTLIDCCSRWEAGERRLRGEGVSSGLAGIGELCVWVGEWVGWDGVGGGGRSTTCFCACVRGLGWGRNF